MRYILPKGYLSASAISTLQNCPRQFEFRYVKGIVIPPNAALATGSCVHKTLETYYKDAISSRERLTPEQAGELSVTTLEEWTEDNENTMTSDEKEGAKRLLPGIVTDYVARVGRNISPTAVEQEVRFTTEDGVPLLGYIDLLHVLPGGEECDNPSVGIGDYKVTSKKWAISELRNSLQFNLYAMMTGIGDVEIHNMMKTPPKSLARKPKDEDGVIDHSASLRVLRHHFDGSQAGHFTRLVEAAARLITSGVFMPCSPTSWCCTPQWCGYWKLCRGM